jgi:hypothetical protein
MAALLVATAGAPQLSIRRALTASHALGSTNTPVVWWSARNVDAWLMSVS